MVSSNEIKLGSTQSMELASAMLVVTESVGKRVVGGGGGGGGGAGAFATTALEGERGGAGGPGDWRTFRKSRHTSDRCTPAMPAPPAGKKCDLRYDLRAAHLPPRGRPHGGRYHG